MWEKTGERATRVPELKPCREYTVWLPSKRVYQWSVMCSLSVGDTWDWGAALPLHHQDRSEGILKKYK